MSSNDKNVAKYLVVKAKGGMGNRMLCAITGIIYGQLTGRMTVIDWRDAGYSNDRSNTFSRFFDCHCIYPETVFPAMATIRPAVWKNNLDKSMSEMISRFDPKKHSSLRIHRKYSVDIRRLDYDEDIVVFWYYTGRIRAIERHLRNRQNSLAGLDTNEIIRKVLLEEMKLSDEVRQHLDDYKSANWPDKVIGVHIRHTDLRTNLLRYERPLRKFLRRSPKAHIFLATDNLQVNEDYHKRFKNVFSIPKWFPESMASMHQNVNCPDKVANGIEALVDMYLLADCDYLIYPGSSTFSCVSRLLSNKPPEKVVDIERFNPKVRLKKLIRELVA